MARMSDEPSAQLVAKYCEGDELAAAALFDRYVGRLTRLAASRLSVKLARRTDADDVVQSAFRSFFVRVRDGRLAVSEEDKLWKLLAPIALHKLYRQARRHRAERRSVDVEDTPASFGELDATLLAGDPTPEEAAAFADELASILSRLDPFSRDVLELRLQGESLNEISAQTGRSERTVRRALERIRSLVLDDPNGISPNGLLPPQFHRVKSRTSTREKSRNAASTERSAVPVVSYSDYRIERLIGAGGVGKVYRATVRGRVEEVAVKFLRKSFHDDREAVARFRAEAALVATLNHPGIVRVHGIGQTAGGLYFMAMDLVQGSDLSRIVKARAVRQSEAIDWISQACTPIEHVHGRGVIHCDLKPSNLLLGADGRIRVTDFGFARSQFSANRGVAGTASFMAPEQISDDWGPIGPRTDIYGLGAVLYWLLTGHAPFEGRRADDVLAQVVSTQAVAPPNLAQPDLPGPLNSVCVKCLAKRAEDRFSSAQDLERVLSTISGEPVNDR
jgi:RNA polymerase sigma factor (sigma-70 family)